MRTHALASRCPQRPQHPQHPQRSRGARGARRARVRDRGFTLIELAIVVVVVGILAVLAILGYRKYTASARTTEAKHVTAGIRAAQEAYKGEKGIYAPVSMDDASFYPASSPGKFVTAWGAKCTNCVNGDPDAWKQLAVEPGAPVMYGYATIAGVGGTTAGGGGPSVQGPGAASFMAPLKATDPFYVTVAYGDTDGDGMPCTVTSYSTSNQLVVQSEGE
jgi:type IV pilus assembly protein PilA